MSSSFWRHQVKTIRTILLSTLFFLPLAAPAETTYLCKTSGAQIQQLRIYEVNRSNRDNFHERFQDHALRIMKRYDFNVVDMWESDTGTKLQFVYILAWPNQAVMESRWKSFLADQEWIDIKKRTGAEHGELVKEANGQPLVRVSYSPACKAE
jgi:hypothetical protein